MPSGRRAFMNGEDNHNWRGGRRIDKNGYVLIYSPDHPNRDKNNLVREHRLVMEAVLRRYLSPSEIVHHRDGNRQNNHRTNLQLTTQKAHNKIHHKGNKNLLGFHHSEETKKKIAESGKGRLLSEEAKKKISEKAKERWNDPKRRDKQREMSLSKWKNPAFRKDRSNPWDDPEKRENILKGLRNRKGKLSK